MSFLSKNDVSVWGGIWGLRGINVFFGLFCWFRAVFGVFGLDRIVVSSRFWDFSRALEACSVGVGVGGVVCRFGGLLGVGWDECF